MNVRKQAGTLNVILVANSKNEREGMSLFSISANPNTYIHSEMWRSEL